jgi:hypothetical protein
MQKRTKSLLEELDAISLNRDVPHLVESRGTHIISSAINLIELINRHYSKEKAELLEKKLLSAIKNKDQGRFSKSVKKNENI